MKKWLIEILFGCSHERTTFPMSVRGNSDPRQAAVICLDCGRRWRYDFVAMQQGEELR